MTPVDMLTWVIFIGSWLCSIILLIAHMVNHETVELLPALALIGNILVGAIPGAVKKGEGNDVICFSVSLGTLFHILAGLAGTISLNVAIADNYETHGDYDLYLIWSSITNMIAGSLAHFIFVDVSQKRESDIWFLLSRIVYLLPFISMFGFIQNETSELQIVLTVIAGLSLGVASLVSASNVKSKYAFYATVETASFALAVASFRIYYYKWYDILTFTAICTGLVFSHYSRRALKTNNGYAATDEEEILSVEEESIKDDNW
jgi:hypothetical protein